MKLLGRRAALLVSSALVNVACIGAALAQDNPKFQFDIPAESLSQALKDFSTASSQQILFSDQVVGRRQAPALKGSYSREQALAILLAGSDLRVDTSSTGVLMVQSKNVRAASDDGAATVAAESVTVTGSRVITDIANSPTPIVSVSADELLTTTPTSIPDALNKLPQFMNGTSSGSLGPITRNASGTTLELRNLGNNLAAYRTLILLDGHRVPPTSVDGSVNVDILPQALMKRVDVVTSGASAVYGSDAVAGVVNFVLDKKFSGFKYDLNAGLSNYGVGMEYQGSLAAGSDLFGGRGHVEGSLRFKQQDEIRESALPLASGGQAWITAGAGTATNPFYIVKNGRESNTSYGGVITCTGCAANNMQFIQNGIVGPFNPGASAGVAGVSIGGDGAIYGDSTAWAGKREAEAFGRFSYDLNDTTSAYVQVALNEAADRWQKDPVGAGGTFFANNVYLTPAAQALLANPSGKFALSEQVAFPGNTPLMLRYRGLADSQLVTAGADGLIWGRYSWDVYYTHGQTRQKLGVDNNVNLQKLYAAQDAVLGASGAPICYVSTTSSVSLYPGCVPINPFGPSSLTQGQLSYITASTYSVSSNSMDDVGGSISGDVFELPAGPIKAALSAEARWNSLSVVASPGANGTVNCTGLRLCAQGSLYSVSGLASENASNDVYELALEANVPILRDIPLIQSFNADLAGRFTNYSTSGAIEAWKIGLDYHVNDGVRLRGSASVDIRAPSLNDLFAPRSSVSSRFSDLLTGVSGNIPFITGGNPDLKPEVAHTWTGGVVLTPSFVPGLMASLDYFRIILSSGITTYNYQGAVAQSLCFASAPSYSSPFCLLAQRPIAPGQPGYTSPANFPTAIYSEAINTGALRTEGWDAEIDYQFDVNDVLADVPGSVNLRAVGTYQPYDVAVNPGSPLSTYFYPKGRMTLFTGYTVGSWAINLQTNWQSDYDPRNTASQVYSPADQRIGSYTSVDATVSKTVTVDDSKADFYLNVQNITDVQGPLSPQGATPNQYYPIHAFLGHTVGRYFTIGVRGTF